jgi:hypothetical protein
MGLGVYCECGKCLPVTESDAGRSLVCSCGFTVLVPLIEEFRDQPVQLSAATVERRIRRLIAAGQLPAKDACIRCGEVEATSVVSVHLVCERAEERTRIESVRSNTVIPGLVRNVQVEYRTEVYGSNTEVPVPICLCQVCRGQLFASSRAGFLIPAVVLLAAGMLLGYFSILLGVVGVVAALAVSYGLMKRTLQRRQRAIKDVLRKVPVYSQILKRYPYAAVIVLEDDSAGQEEPPAPGRIKDEG